MSMQRHWCIGAATLAAASAASADFIGFDGRVAEIGEYTVIKMYALYDQPDIALNLFNAQVDAKDGAGFSHSDIQVGAGGTWQPTASIDIPGFSDSSIDSFVTVGYGVGEEAAFNGTSLDCGWVCTGGSGIGPKVPPGAGWYNSIAGNDQVAEAQAGFDYAVWVGQFAFATARVDAAGARDFFTFDLQIGSIDANGEVFFGQDYFVWTPAPGALAIFGLGGVAFRRRRV